jgi:hypothetical protein
LRERPSNGTPQFANEVTVSMNHHLAYEMYISI